MNVWAFNKPNEESRMAISESIKNGKSRFGWSYKEKHNLLLENNWTDEHSKNLFLKEINVGDWIVHINLPEWGMCTAGQVTKNYQFDDGIPVTWGEGFDFRHAFELDKESIVTFRRRDENVLPNVNLNPRYRYHRVYAVDEFIQSIQNLNKEVVNISEGETKELYHLKGLTKPYLKELSQKIHQMNRSKNFELYLKQVFEKIPGVIDVKKNGFGWGTDYGADLIVTTNVRVGNLDVKNIIVVQAKSFRGNHNDLKAVENIRSAFSKYNPQFGMIISTGERTEKLENAIQDLKIDLEKSLKREVEIDLIAGEEVAQLVLKYAPELLFHL